MKKFSKEIVILTFILLLASCVTARIYVQVINRLENDRHMNVHCRSRDDDLGYHVVEEGGSTVWSFTVNFWGTTLFYCDVQWGDSKWYHFDAYDAKRDNNRCRSLCRWLISKEGLLYGYDEESGLWELFPLIPIT